MSKQDLVDAYNKLNVKHAFTPGDIVEWKPGLANKKGAGPFVVVEVLETPVLDSVGDPGSTYFREPLDLILGEASPQSGALITFHYDSRRFQPTLN